MTYLDSAAQPADQHWIVNREHLARWRFDIDDKIRGIGGDGVQAGDDAFCLGQVVASPPCPDGGNAGGRAASSSAHVPSGRGTLRAARRF